MVLKGLNAKKFSEAVDKSKSSPKLNLKDEQEKSKVILSKLLKSLQED